MVEALGVEEKSDVLVETVERDLSSLVAKVKTVAAKRFVMLILSLDGGG